jgi:hypothetical protein
MTGSFFVYEIFSRRTLAGRLLPECTAGRLPLSLHDGRVIPTTAYPMAFSYHPSFLHSLADLAQPDRLWAIVSVQSYPSIELLFHYKVSSFLIKLDVKALITINSVGISGVL